MIYNLYNILYIKFNEIILGDIYNKIRGLKFNLKEGNNVAFIVKREFKTQL